MRKESYSKGRQSREVRSSGRFQGERNERRVGQSKPRWQDRDDKPREYSNRDSRDSFKDRDNYRGERNFESRGRNTEGRGNYSESRFADRRSGRNSEGRNNYSESRFSDRRLGRNSDKNSGGRSFERGSRDGFRQREGFSGGRNFEPRSRNAEGRGNYSESRSRNAEGRGNYSESRFAERRFGRNSEGQNSEGRSFDRGSRDGFMQRDNDARPFRREISEEAKSFLREKHYSKKKILAHSLKSMNSQSELRLNRFISMGGVCSRRDADVLISEGRVQVNGEVIEEVGFKVVMSDRVEVDGKMIIPEKKVYILLNKPKDFVTTVEDPLNRKTVMSLIEGACKERVYPVGRLDRNTTGVLLFTNDGDFAKKLTHPSYDRKKIYHVFLNKAINDSDIDTIREGFKLEDGFIKADEINITSTDKMEVGIEIHSGRNRIVRRIFEHLGYEVEKLDRVYFAGITKKNVPRGKWRHLTAKEVSLLKIY